MMLPLIFTQKIREIRERKVSLNGLTELPGSLNECMSGLHVFLATFVLVVLKLVISVLKKSPVPAGARLKVF